MLSAKWGLSARLASNGILRVKQLVFSFLLEDLLGSNKTIKSGQAFDLLLRTVCHCW